MYLAAVVCKPDKAITDRGVAACGLVTQYLRGVTDGHLKRLPGWGKTGI